jgi:RNA polymerase sigma factor FliA
LGWSVNSAIGGWTRAGSTARPIFRHLIGSVTSHMRNGAKESTTKVEDLVQRYHVLAEQLTSMMLARVPRTVDRSELQSAAMFGLFQAAQAWEPDRGVTFEAFARHRIRGALLDELRGRDWASRRVRSFARVVSAANDELTATLGRRPTDAELADLLGVSVEAIEANERDLHLATVRSSDTLTEESSPLAGTTEEDPQAALEQREQYGYLHGAVHLLPERLRRVVIGYYVDEVPMQLLAEELGVTESRISQMRAEAVRLLRGALSGALAPEQVGDVAFGEFVSQRALDMAEELQTGADCRDRLGLRLVS